MIRIAWAAMVHLMAIPTQAALRKLWEWCVVCRRELGYNQGEGVKGACFSNTNCLEECPEGTRLGGRVDGGRRGKNRHSPEPSYFG